MQTEITSSMRKIHCLLVILEGRVSAAVAMSEEPSYHSRLRNKLRWLAMSVFAIASLLNYLDRALLGTLAPKILGEFHLDEVQLGWIVSAYSLTYALTSPVMGALMDRLGLNTVITGAVGLWSLAGAATGLTGSLAGLLGCRTVLGLGESAGIPAVAKAGGIYLPPEERSLGSALSQVGLSAGGVLAVLVGTPLALRYGWRFPFIVTGLAGLLWIPLWLAVSRRVKPGYENPTAKFEIWWDRRLFALIAANVLWMGLYSLWSFWTTLYLTEVQKLTLAQSQWYSWIAPVASNLGAFLGGWLALRGIRKGRDPIAARLRVVLISATGVLLTLFLPLAPTAGWAMAVISVSYFWTLAGSVNIYVIPVDLFGPERAGFAISALVFAYGLMQFVVSPVIGHFAKTGQWGTVVWMLSLPPMLAWALLRVTVGGSPRLPPRVPY
jgi:ACS family hexuronate transporter-like MFS transporter